MDVQGALVTVNAPPETQNRSEDEDDGNSQASSVDSSSSRKSNRHRRPPASHSDYIRTDKPTSVHFNLNREDDNSHATDNDDDEVERLIREQNERLNFDPYEEIPEAEVVVDSENETEGEPPKKKRGRPSTRAPSSTVNPPDLYFVGQCERCIFAASYFDVTSGLVYPNGTVTLPVYGPSRVIYDKIKTEEEAVERAKEEGFGNPKRIRYGKSDGRYISYIRDPPDRTPYDNDDRFALVEDDNRKLRVENQKLRRDVSSLTSRVLRLEEFVENVLTGAVTINPEIGHEAAPIRDSNGPPLSAQPLPQTTHAQPRVIALSEVQDAPNWTILSQAAAKDLYETNPKPSAFIRSVYKNMFTDLQSFQMELPADDKKEFEKICLLYLSPTTAAELRKVKEMINDEKTYQRDRLRTKLTVPKSGAVAMITKAVALTKVRNAWEPVDGSVQFQHLAPSNVSKWPVLFKQGQVGDTMLAERKDPENDRSYWNYFIVTRDGALIECTKD